MGMPLGCNPSIEYPKTSTSSPTLGVSESPDSNGSSRCREHEPPRGAGRVHTQHLALETVSVLGTDGRREVIVDCLPVFFNYEPK